MINLIEEESSYPFNVICWTISVIADFMQLVSFVSPIQQILYTWHIFLSAIIRTRM